MGSFASYMDGTRQAPVLTLVIGGNHEASNHMQERYHGGWLAPNIYFVGIAGVLRVGGVRVAGLSGIFNARSFHKGHFEVPPYSESDIRSVYHVRSFEVFQLAHLAQPIDVFLSHDWPRGIYRFGNANDLFRRKSFLAAERDEFGSPANADLLLALKPTFWFCGHMHVKFAAVVPHAPAPAAPETEQLLVSSASAAQLPTPRSTYFLALDKVGPGKQFLQLVQIEPGKSPANGLGNATPAPNASALPPSMTSVISIDREWLAIVHATRRFFNGTPSQTVLPSPEQIAPLLEASKKLVADNIRDEDLLVPPVFAPQMPGVMDMLLMRLQMLDGSAVPVTVATNKEEIDLGNFDDDDDDDDDNARDDGGKDVAANATAAVNTEAVDLPEFDD